MSDIVSAIGKQYGFQVTFRSGLAIYMAHNSVKHNGNVHAAVLVNINANDIKAECIKKADELKVFISENN